MEISRPNNPRYGVVAVVAQRDTLLVIRRSQFVRAPGAFCFPGGGIESGESEEVALVREMKEELDTQAFPVRRLWQSVTASNVHLAWWLTDIPDADALSPNAAEVESHHWLPTHEIRRLPELLASNHAFFEAWDRQAFSLPMDDILDSNQSRRIDYT